MENISKMKHPSKISFIMSALFFLWFMGEAIVAIVFKKNFAAGKFLGNTSTLDSPSHIIIAAAFLLIALFPVVPFFMKEKAGNVVGQTLLVFGLALFTVGHFM